jgi:dihydroxyacid dehydratase/phosphogluconate dehydratase
MRELRSQQLRRVNHQGDALRLGMNWTEEDLGKPQILVESAYGMGHPGTFHFRPLIEEVSNGVFEAGGKPGVFTVSDICDGVAQAHAGMSYSLVSRDVQAAMIEIHALGHPHDGMVLISGNDKSVPAHLLAMARCDLPAIHLPGGTRRVRSLPTRCGGWARRWSAVSCRASNWRKTSTAPVPPVAPASSWAAPAPARYCPKRSVWRCRAAR